MLLQVDLRTYTNVQSLKMWYFCFLENPYLRLLSDTFIYSLVYFRPTLLYVIAVDSDGVREQQKSLNSTASFEFINKNGQYFNHSLNFTEFMETSLSTL